MNRKHGITGPLSTKDPTPTDITKASTIHTLLTSSHFFEPLSESLLRERVLGRLAFLATQFCNGHIYTFGSYRLGVHMKGADIDTLLVSTCEKTYLDFFTEFYDKLLCEEGVSRLVKIEDAYVPLIKLRMCDISIDLLFARLAIAGPRNVQTNSKITNITSSRTEKMTSEVDNNVLVTTDDTLINKHNTNIVNVSTSNINKSTPFNLLDDTLLKHIDDKSILSLNGSRVTDMLIDLVPCKITFHGALRCIKYWAKRRGIYGNSYGYLGGVAYAICVARICQFYPRGNSYMIILKFHELYSVWKWPAPVKLNQVVDKNYNLKVWDPKSNASDRYHRMPVITPAYPAMCSTHNVGVTTLGVMMGEFKRAADILREDRENDNPSTSDFKDLNKKMKYGFDCGDNEINKLESEDNNKLDPFLETLKKLFQPTDFFMRYKFYIHVKITDTEKWRGYIESKIRLLCSKIETGCVEVPNALKAVPFPSTFVLKDGCGNNKKTDLSNLKNIKNEYTKSECIKNEYTKNEYIKSEGIKDNSIKEDYNKNDDTKNDHETLIKNDNKNLIKNDNKNLTKNDNKNLTKNDNKKLTKNDNKNLTKNDNKNLTKNDNKNITKNDNKNLTKNDNKNITKNDNKNLTKNDNKNLTKNDSTLLSDITKPNECILKLGTVSFFVGIEYKEKMCVNLDVSIKEFVASAMVWEKRDDEIITVRVVKKKEVGEFLREFYSQGDGKTKVDKDTDKNGDKDGYKNRDELDKSLVNKIDGDSGDKQEVTISGDKQEIKISGEQAKRKTTENTIPNLENKRFKNK